MAIVGFNGDEEGYFNWLASHAQGWVINCRGNGYIILHRASCRTIADCRRGLRRTLGVLKLCADQRAEVQPWLDRSDCFPCFTCRP